MDETFQASTYYTLETVSRLLDLNPRTILRYERQGLIRAAILETGEGGRTRCYAQETVIRIRRIHWLTAELGVNLAGVEVILNLLDQLEALYGDRRR